MHSRRAVIRAVTLVGLAAAFVLASLAGAVPFEVRALDGSRNNLRSQDWGRANTPYLRVARSNYADGIATPVGGPSARYVSNRIFNDTSQNLFSENGVTQWGFVWGQFLDHTFGLRQEAGGESAPIPFDTHDPLETFRNDFGSIGFTCTPAAPGTGVRSPREQINTVPSYIDAFAVYGGSAGRLEWLLSGPVDGQMGNSGPRLLLDRGYLDARTRSDEQGRNVPIDEARKEELLINALRAAALVDGSGLEAAVQRLRDGDPSPRVRQAAIETLRQMGASAAQRPKR